MSTAKAAASKRAPRNISEGENVFDGEFDPSKAKVKKDLSNDFKWELEKDYYFKFLGPMEVREEKEEKATDGKKPRGRAKRTMEPPTVAEVYDLKAKRTWSIIIGAVVKARLKENYDNDDYVGKTFHMVKHAQEKGKRYSRYTVEEIEVTK